MGLNPVRPIGRGIRLLSTVVVLAGAAMALPATPALHAQAPDARWRTIDTEHFRVHFTPPLEELARRSAGNAERAYRQLASELVPPRGRIDIVVADNVDYSNGSATPFPTNRILIYAHPPVDATSLRFYDDWNTMVVTHELTHIFHLDRTRGWWGVAQRIFGRSPFLFPGQYLPAWVTEGIAVYYESRLTGSGRVVGSQHRVVTRAAAAAGRFPALGDLSLATPRFPGGEQAYAFGGLFVDYLARTAAAAGGSKGVPAFIEAQASAPIPFLLDQGARRGFGTSFRSAWRAWRDSLERDGPPGTGASSSHMTALVDRQWQARGPRWLGPGTIVVGLNPGREVPGAYAVTMDGRVDRIGRRNDASAQAPVAGGGLLYAQLDYTDPFRIRSDLYLSRDGQERRLTNGERLFRPDARQDGEIVAVQGAPGTTRLVRLPPNGARTVAITPAVADTQWTEPRWSPDGTRIAAIRWRVGGVSEVVVLDTLGTVQSVLAGGRAVFAAPSWAPDGRSIVYASDSSGRPELYSVDAIERDGASIPPVARRLSATGTGLYEPEFSPDGATLAALRYTPDGWEVVVRHGASPLDSARAGAVASGARPTADASSPGATPSAAVLPPAAPADGAARPYSALPSLLPRYWVPLLRIGDREESFVGASTGMRDVIGRHSYAAEALVGTATGLVEGSLAYRYFGLGNPSLDIGVSQQWQRLAIYQSDGAIAGERRRQTRVASMAATFQRPRVRSNSWLTLGGELERRGYSTDPAPLLARLDPFFHRSHTTPTVQVSGGWSNSQRPFLAISPEDGVAASFTVAQRWLDDDVRPTTRSAVGAVVGYRSIPQLPGFAHHVVVARVAGGWSDNGATTEFEVGGVSGGAVELIPGVVVGEGSRTFGVRGVPAGSARGIRAVGGTVEYRAPLAAPGRGLGVLPLFVDRAAVVLFADAAAAWCPPTASTRPACVGARTRANWLGAAGVELDVDLAVPYDEAYRGRLGVAFPRAHEGSGVSGGARVFVGVGRAF